MLAHCENRKHLKLSEQEITLQRVTPLTVCRFSIYEGLCVGVKAGLYLFGSFSAFYFVLRTTS